MDVDRLIYEVRSRGALWNQMHSQYNNRIVVDKMWDEISTVMDVPKKLLRTKWKSLRDNFRQEIKKIPKHCVSEDGSSTGYVPTWAHFPKLTFLTEQMSLRQPFLLNVSEHFNEINEDSPDNTQEPQSEDICFLSEEPDQPTVTNGRHPQKRKSTTPTTTSDKRQYIPSDSADDSFSYFDENSSHEGNDDYHFFMSLLPYVRSLPRPKAMLLRMKIQEMVYNELFNPLSSHSEDQPNFP